jgi:superfamily II DNA or RNA helicase
MMQHDGRTEATDTEITESTLLQKLSPSDSARLLKNSLGHEMTLLKEFFDGQALTHLQACRSLVALHGLQILRNREIRTAIVDSAHEDQVRSCFSQFLAEQETLKSDRDFELSDMRTSVANHAWHSASTWSRLFCEAFELPMLLSGREVENDWTPYEVVEPFVILHELHDFQKELRVKVESILSGSGPNRGLVALPTGAGKTRLLVDTALGLDDVACGRRCVIWLAQHDELCEQAVQCFAQVWRSEERPGGRDLTIQRVWKGLNKTIDWTADVVIGTLESLVERLGKTSAAERSRVLLTVIDEAHHALAPSYQALFSLLSSSKIVGITATPGFAIKLRSHLLRKRFGDHLLTSDLLGPNPVDELQRRLILAIPRYETQQTNYKVGSEIIDTDAIAQFGDLPPKILGRLGKSVERNKIILARLLEIDPGDGSVLCFASSVLSSRALAAALVMAGRTARSIDATSERCLRAEAIGEFRAGRLQFLINYGVLATGFDAPKVSVLVMARPTTSPILFEQMLGRGLRGPLNGGTEYCTIIYFEDDFTGFGQVRPLSYARFLE